MVQGSHLGTALGCLGPPAAVDHPFGGTCGLGPGRVRSCGHGEASSHPKGTTAEARFTEGDAMKDRFFLGGAFITLLIVAIFFGTRDPKTEARKRAAAQEIKGADVESVRIFVLRTMAKDLCGPESPQGPQLVAALGLIRQIAAKGDFQGVGTPEDEALAGIIRRYAENPDPAVRAAAKGILEAIPKGPRVTTRGTPNIRVTRYQVASR